MIPDYFEAITAYRCWNVHDNGLLVGQNQGEPWPPYQAFLCRCGAASEKHIKDGEFMPAPLWYCTCGIHAYTELEAAEARTKANSWVWGFNTIGSGAVVWGEVKIWGKVIVHAIGYRAEFGYPGELWCDDEKVAGRVATLYGVTCHFRDIGRNTSHYYGGGPKRYPSTYYISPTQHAFWRNTLPPVPKVKPTPLLQQASLAQIKAIGATPWQQAQAQMQAGRRGGKTAAQTAWLEMWKNGFKLYKSGSALILKGQQPVIVGQS